MIRLTKLSDYGLVVLTHFANHPEQRVWNAKDVAESVHLPVPTVSKLLKAFTRGGLLKAHRGVRGGYSLAQDPASVTLPQIVEILEGPVAITECQRGSDTDCLLKYLCPLRPTWTDVNKAVRESLEKVTLAHLAENAAAHKARVEQLLESESQSHREKTASSKLAKQVKRAGASDRLGLGRNVTHSTKK